MPGPQLQSHFQTLVLVVFPVSLGASVDKRVRRHKKAKKILHIF